MRNNDDDFLRDLNKGTRTWKLFMALLAGLVIAAVVLVLILVD
jgi:hypothetical protein